MAKSRLTPRHRPSGGSTGLPSRGSRAFMSALEGEQLELGLSKVRSASAKSGA